MCQMLGPDRKRMLLEQIKRNPNAFPKNQLLKILSDFSDVSMNDFNGIVSEGILADIRNSYERTAFEKRWNEIKSTPANTEEEIASLKAKISSLKTGFTTIASEPQYGVSDLEIRLESSLQSLQKGKEDKDWNSLDKNDYNALRNYRQLYPNSFHLDEIDDYMWECNELPMPDNFDRYLNDNPSGRHADEARQLKAQYQEFQDLINSDNIDISKLGEIAQNSSNEQLREQAQGLFENIRANELAKMHEAPNQYPADKAIELVEKGYFTLHELIEEEKLTTKECWKKMQLKNLPDIRKHVKPNAQLAAPENCTDIYFFGIPGSGKTCLLMSLTAVNGRNGFTINLVKQGGDYAADLNTYYNNGRTPGRTYGSFCTVINGAITETIKGKTVKHNINLVEMSGEAFAVNIARNPDAKVDFSQMGTGATNLLMNNNRKAFFIVVDASVDTIEFKHLVDEMDAQGNVVNQNVEKLAVDQNIILTKFMNLFEENPEVMEKVDSIHFVVTKSDVLGDTMEQQLQAARVKLLTNYLAPVTALKQYCNADGRINAATDYIPHVFAFSLGKFYLGDVFDDDLDDTLEIVTAIKCVTSSVKTKTWWDKFRETIG